MRVYELAKQLDLDNKTVIDRLSELGVEVSSNFNAVSDADVDRLEKALAANAPAPQVSKTKSKKKAKPTKKTKPTVKTRPRPAAKSRPQPEPPVETEPGIDLGPEAATGTEAGPASDVEIDREPQSEASTPEEQAVAVTIEGSMTVEQLAEEAGDQSDVIGVAEDRQLLGDLPEAVPENLETRGPVVTIMGHVDHGKTLLLDALRQTDVADREAGGITQHIGASAVEFKGRRIVLVDTPGHEAFTRMRARGAQITDLVVLVVAADDGVMPQTLEAIDHARAAGVPILVAINKIDRAEANVDRAKQQLAERNLVPDDWGGDTVCVAVSAKEKQNLDELLEMILLSADLLELQADPSLPARGVVLEAKLDRRRGAVATLLIQQGTLRVGESLVAGPVSAKVRAMVESMGKSVKEAGPATAVEVLGFAEVPQAGDSFQVVKVNALARRVADLRQERQRVESLASSQRFTLEDLHQRLREEELTKLAVVVKADTQGSVEVLSDALRKLATDRIQIDIIRAGVGGITETDILLASASEAMIVGFNVRPERGAADAATREKVELRLYTVIYQLIDEIRQAMQGRLEPIFEERELGAADVRETFRIPRTGTIAGCYITSGKFNRDAKVRLLRDSRIIFEGRVGSLRRFKEDVREVQQGYECGIGIANFNDVKVGDLIEAFEVKEITPSN